MKYKYGYCSVTCDFLHIGHIEFLKRCKECCDSLIVGVTSDEYIVKHKNRKPIMNQFERCELVKSIRFVNSVLIQNDFYFPETILRIRDYNKERFIIIDSDENALKRKGADIIIKGGIRRKYGIRSSQKIEYINNS